VLLATAAIAAVAATALSAPTTPASSTPAASAEPAGTSPTGVGAWVDRHAHPLTSLSPDAPAHDLRPLRHVARHASVVGLGEATHGSHEQFRLKHRMVRYLVEEMGFRTVAFEDDFASGVAIDRYVTTGAGDARRLVSSMSSPFWSAEEIVDLVEWMRTYNEAHPDDPVRFLGTDVLQLRESSFAAITGHVALVAPQRLAELEERLAQLRLQGSHWEHMQAYRELPDADQERLIATGSELVAFLEGLPAGDDPAGHELAVRHARAIHGWYENYDEDLGVRAEREQFIADTILWWQGLTGHEVAYWAANVHTASAPDLSYRYSGEELAGTMAGGHLEARLGRRYASVGSLFHAGTISSNYEAPGPQAIGPPAPGLLEATLGTAPQPTYLLPLDRPAPAAVRRWLGAESTMRVILPSYAEGQDSAGYTMTVPSLRDAFDAVVFVRDTTASRLILPDRPT
jgi:erythromycin esterase